MEKLQITKGEWEIRGNKIFVKDTYRTAALATRQSEFVYPEPQDKEKEFILDLIKDAGNTYQQCEILPSELLRHNREMKEALEKAEEALEWYMTECTPDNDNYQSFHDIGMNARSVLRECLISCNKGKE